MAIKVCIKTLVEASQHLHYEYQVFQTTFATLCSGALPDGSLHDSILESFLIHGRNLLHFLYPKRPQRGDVLAEHYFKFRHIWETHRGNLPSGLYSFRGRVNKFVAHLTYDRIGLTFEEKTWNPGKVFVEISKKLAVFRTSVDIELLSPEWREWKPKEKP